MDGAVRQADNGTACQQSSPHLHPSNHTGHGKIILSWTWYCPWFALCQEYTKHEIYIASDYNISCSILAWFSRIMKATSHRRDILPANLLGECRCWTAWNRWGIEVDLPLRINHSGRLHSWESKSGYHIFIQWVSPATCRLDQDNIGDVSWLWGLVNLIPRPSSMCVSKLLNGMIITDTCNTARLTRSTVINLIYGICIDKGMSDQNLKFWKVRDHAYGCYLVSANFWNSFWQLFAHSFAS